MARYPGEAADQMLRVAGDPASVPEHAGVQPDPHSGFLDPNGLRGDGARAGSRSRSEIGDRSSIPATMTAPVKATATTGLSDLTSHSAASATAVAAQSCPHSRRGRTVPCRAPERPQTADTEGAFTDHARPCGGQRAEVPHERERDREVRHRRDAQDPRVRTLAPAGHEHQAEHRVHGHDGERAEHDLERTRGLRVADAEQQRDRLRRPRASRPDRRRRKRPP